MVFAIVFYLLPQDESWKAWVKSLKVKVVHFRISVELNSNQIQERTQMAIHTLDILVSFFSLTLQFLIGVSQEFFCLYPVIFCAKEIKLQGSY